MPEPFAVTSTAKNALLGSAHEREGRAGPAESRKQALGGLLLVDDARTFGP